MRNFLFISLDGIDTNVIHLLVLFEDWCHVHCLDTNVICLFVLFRHRCCMSIHVVYKWKSCTQLMCLNNAWHLYLHNKNLDEIIDFGDLLLFVTHLSSLSSNLNTCKMALVICFITLNIWWTIILYLSSKFITHTNEVVRYLDLLHYSYLVPSLVTCLQLVLYLSYSLLVS